MEFSQIKLGDVVSITDIRNTDLSVTLLLGISNTKKMIPSIANINGTDLSTYKIVKKNQFAYIPTTSRNGDKVSIAMLKEANECIVSSSYITFEIIKPDVIDADYLMLLFGRPEFDRYARFNSWGTAREVFSWEDFCNIEINLPSLDEQKKLVRQYNTIVNRIDVLERLNEKLLALEKVLYWNFLKENSDRQELKNINELFEIKYGKGLPTEKLMNDGFLVYGGNGIIGKYSKCLYEKPQILVSCRGASSGAVLISLENIFVTSNSLVMELKDYDLFDFYRLYFLDNPLYEYVTGSAQPQLTIDSLNKCQIPVFDKSDLLPLTSKLHSIWKLKNRNTIEIMKLNEFRQTFLKNI